MSEGHRYKGDKTPEVYLLLDSKLRHIANPDVYEALFGSKNIEFETVDQKFIDNFPKGPQLNRKTPLVQGLGPKVWLVDEGKKRWIKNPDVFNRYHFSWDKIVRIGDVSDLVADGSDIA